MTAHTFNSTNTLKMNVSTTNYQINYKLYDFYIVVYLCEKFIDDKNK